MKWILGIIMIAIGFGMIWKTDLLMRSFGRIDWAERKLGAGGSWTFYKLIGLAVMFLAFLIMTGGIFGILDFLFGN